MTHSDGKHAITNLPTRGARLLLGLLLTSLALSAIYGLWKSLSWKIAIDTPLLHYIAWRILDGAVPYRDLLDMNLPFVLWIHMLNLRVFGFSDLAWRVFELTWQGATCFSIFLFLKPLRTQCALFGALLYCTAHLGLGNWVAGERDFYCTIFLVLGTLFAIKVIQSTSLRVAILQGVAFGCAASIKPPYALLMLFILVFQLTALPSGNRFKTLAVILGASLVAPLLSFLWLWQIGALPSFIDFSLNYLLPVYPRLGRMAYANLYGLISGSLGIFLPLVLLRQTGICSMEEKIAGVAILGCLMCYFIQGKGWIYQAQPIFAFASILAALRLTQIRSLSWDAVSACIALGVCFSPLYHLNRPRMAPLSTQTSDRIEGYLAAKLQPGDEVQSLDLTDGVINALFRLKVKQPSRFIYDFFLYNRPLTGQRELLYFLSLRREMANAILTRRPRFIIAGRTSWPNAGLAFSRLNRMGGLDKILRENYKEVISDFSLRIYERIPRNNSRLHEAHNSGGSAAPR